MHFMSAAVCCSFAVHLWASSTAATAAAKRWSHKVGVGRIGHCPAQRRHHHLRLLFLCLCVRKVISDCLSLAHTRMSHTHRHGHACIVSVCDCPPRMPHCVACCALIVQRKCCGGIKINKCISFPLGTLCSCSGVSPEKRRGVAVDGIFKSEVVLSLILACCFIFCTLNNATNEPHFEWSL